MPSRLVVDQQNQLQQVNNTAKRRQPALIRVPAILFSYIFHPLFIPAYLTYFLIRVHPYLFSGIDEWGKLSTLLQVILNCTFLPLISLLLLKGLKFIDSIFLHTQKDRIVPYVICMVFYFWNWYVFRNNQGVEQLVEMSLGVFIASILGFLANISIKVSMHAVAVGLMCTFMAYLVFDDSINITVYLVFAVIITGIVCTSRMLVSDHSQKEIYSGLAIGIVAQLAAHLIN